MNRRTFISGSISALAFAPILGQASAQKPQTVEARWDDTSQLYGNAWDVLGVATENQVEIVSIGSVGYQNEYGHVNTFAVVHNNSNVGIRVAALRSDSAPTSVGPIGSIQFTMTAYAYALISLKTLPPLAGSDDLQDMTVAFEIDEFYAANPGHVPLRVESVTFNDSTVNISIANDSEFDTGDHGRGTIIWIDETGKITGGATFSEGQYISAGERENRRVQLEHPAVTGSRFLIGLWGDLVPGDQTTPPG